MAEKKEELDLDVQAKPAGKKHLILYIVIAVLVLALGGVGAMLFLKDKDKDAGGDEAKSEQAAAPAKTEAHYLPLEKLVVNFSQRGPARFLQIDIQVMSHDPGALAAMQTHMPVIRNDILVLLSGQQFEEVSTPEGKERLRAAILETVQRILKEQADGKQVNAVFFTEFVMQ